MSATANTVGLQQAFRKLNVAWQQTRGQWRDVKSREFEQTYLEPLPQALTQASMVMDEIGNLIRKVKEDCE